jgi:hypothetical protein
MFNAKFKIISHSYRDTLTLALAQTGIVTLALTYLLSP